MTGSDMMDYYVRPRHIFSYSATCTCNGLHRRPSILVAFHICYLLDCASIHEMSSFVIWFQCISDIFIHYGDLDPLYIVCGNDHTWHLYIMPIHGRCTLMYLGLLYVFVVTWKYWSLYCPNEWLVLPPESSLLHLWDGYNVFWPSCYPSDLTH